MSLFTRYLCRIYLVRFGFVLFTVCGFAMLFDLLDIGGRVLRHADGTVLPLLRYMMIRLPSLITELLPLVVLVAGLAAVTELIRHRELVVMWNAGLSRAGVLLRLWPAVLLVAGGKLALDDLAVPATIPELRSLRVADFRTVGLPEAPQIWVTSGHDIVRLPKDAAVTGDLKAILILRRNEQGQLVDRIDAAMASPRDGAWELSEVVIRPAAARELTRLPSMVWPTAIDLEKVGLMAKVPRELTLVQLADVVANDGYGVGTSDSQRTWLHARLAGAIALGAILLLPFALARRFERIGTLPKLWIQGLALGFIWLVGNGFLLALGEVDLIAPEVAAWGAPLAFLVLVAWLGGILEPRRRQAGLAPSRS